MSTRIFTLLLLAILACPFESAAHLIAGRRPLDYFVAQADCMALAFVTGGTRATRDGAGGETKLRIEREITGRCPGGTVTAAGADDHAARLESGHRLLVALKRSSRAGEPAWRILQNEWELGAMNADYVAAAIRLAPKYASALRDDEPARTYVRLLIGQLAEPSPHLQDDALQSLLRAGPAVQEPDAAVELARAALGAKRGNIQIGALAVASAWDAAAIRPALADGPLAALTPAARTRAYAILAAGDKPQAAVPCRGLHAADAAERSAAVTYCRPLDGAWIRIAVSALDDADAGVQSAAARRLSRDDGGRAALRAWALQREPWWRRLYFGATGKEPSVLREITTE